MKNKVVTYTEYTFYYKVKDSEIGKFKRRLHPSLNKDFFYTGDNHHLKVGDILRCDGLPFMSRPKPIKTLNDERVTTREVETVTHKPVKLPSGFWVLREV